MLFLIVEDEFPTRQELRFVLEQLIPEAMIYEAGDGDEALLMLERIQPDVIFLDVNMPKRDGLATAREIVEMINPPLIIFATAYDEHALKAFELSAIDYVVKPFSKRRLTKTVTKIRERLGEKKMLNQQREMIKRLTETASSVPEKGLEKLWVEGETGNRQLVPYDDITYIEARDKMVFVHLRGGDEMQTRYTLKELEARLGPHNYCRIHKGYLVNLNAMAELIPWFSGSYQIKLNDTLESIIPVSRRYAQTLKKKLA